MKDKDDKIIEINKENEVENENNDEFGEEGIDKGDQAILIMQKP